MKPQRPICDFGVGCNCVMKQKRKFFLTSNEICNRNKLTKGAGKALFLKAFFFSRVSSFRKGKKLVFNCTAFYLCNNLKNLETPDWLSSSILLLFGKRGLFKEKQRMIIPMMSNSRTFPKEFWLSDYLMWTRKKSTVMKM